jgi:hypothetical protein
MLTAVIGSTRISQGRFQIFLLSGLPSRPPIGDRSQVLHTRRGLPARFPNYIGVYAIALRDAPSLIAVSPVFAGRQRSARILGGGHEERVLGIGTRSGRQSAH